MRREPSSAELAEAWKAGQIHLFTALRHHFKNIGFVPVNDSVFPGLALVINIANVGMMDTPIPCDDGSNISVSELVTQLQLSDFLGEP